jgi:uncharacterized metal-binding protein
VVIDGCPVGCARKIMDANQISIDRYIVVTELGIDKTHGLDIEDRDIETVVQGVKDSHTDPISVEKDLEKEDNGL